MSGLRVAALVIGIVIMCQGVVGLLLPDVFFAAVRTMQVPPMLYVAAAIRVLFGAILLLAAGKSRAPMVLRCLGVLIVVGGLLTPFVGVEFAKIILGWWAQGAGVIRTWAAFALVLGVFIVLATLPRRNR